MDMRVLVDAMPDCIFVIDADGTLRFVNHAVEQQLRWVPEEWIGRSILDVVHPDDVAGVLSSIESVTGKEYGSPVEVRVLDHDGGWHWYEVIGANAMLDRDVQGIIGVGRDITRRRMWEVASDDLVRFQQVVQFAPGITLLLDADGVVTSVNAAFTRLLGHDQSRVIGEPLTSFVARGSVHQVRAALDRMRNGGRNAVFEVPMRSVGEHGSSRPVRFEMINMIDDPVVHGVVVSGYDVSDLQVMREELEYLAHHDSLTGLATRSALVEHLQRQLRQGQQFAVLFIDLDRFKPVNDLWGHETGDEILRLVGRRLDQSVRPSDLVARVGGDEFVVVAQRIHTQVDAREFADRIEAAISAPYHVDAGPVRIGASVGIALSSPEATVASLLADADLEMYDAKSERRGVPVRSPVERRRSAVERRRLADEFLAGLGRGEIIAHLQPIIDTRNRRLVGLEALARWQHPHLGLLRPVAFIELVEDAGLDVLLGDAVLESACATMSRLADHGVFPELGINLSVGQLTDPELAQRVSATIARYELAPERLVVEITEQAILARRAAVGAVSADETLRSMHAMGAMLSLDDFGTGYSSLTHVRRFPLAAIKIDQTFVSGMCDNAQDHAVIEVIIGLGRALDLLVVAEGVERRDQLDALSALGCDQVQGHLLARPMAGEDAVEWVLARIDRMDGERAARGALTLSALQ